MSSFILKIIALVAMTIDHTGKVFLLNHDLCNILGRIAFPIFAFQIVEGYHHTKNLKKYLTRLLIVAIIAEGAFIYLFSGLNTVFTLLLGLLCIFIYEKETDKFISIALIITIGISALLLNFDYGLYGILMILLFHIFYKDKTKKSIAFAILVILHYTLLILSSNEISLLLPMCSTLAALLFINMYNNKRGPSMKCLFYVYYPLHLYIIMIIKLLTN